MAKRLGTDVGTRVERKYTGRVGIIVKHELSVSSFSRPGVYGQTVVTIRWADDDGIGGPMETTGDLGWFRSNFKPAK